MTVVAAPRIVVALLLSSIGALAAPRAARAQSASCGASGDVVPVVPPQGWAPPLDRPVSLDARDVSLRDALDRMSAAADVRLSYSPDVVPVDRRVCVSFRDVALGGALGVLLRGAGVEARAVGGVQVVLAPLPGPADAARQPTMLERVIVTGSAGGAPERPLSVGVTTISGASLRARGASGTIAELLSGVVPGVWAWSQPPASLLVRYGSIRGASSFDASYPKVYIDGIEVASPLLVSRIDPATVDRIEIIRGPQGAALYGSDAISGVVNIVTRTDGVADGSPRIGLDASGGAIASDYVSRPTVTQRYGLTLRAGSSTRATTLGIDAGGTGAYVPGAWGRDASAIVSSRFVGAKTIVRVMARGAFADASASGNPILGDAVFHQGGSSSGPPAVAFAPSSTEQSREYTVGTTIRLMQTPRLTHNIVIGVDGYRLSGVPPASSPIPSAADAALNDASGAADRGTFRLATVADLGDHAGIATTLTLGAEESILRSATVSSDATVPTIRMIGREAPLGRSASARYAGYDGGRDGDRLDDVTWWNSGGVIAQLNGAYHDAVYLTAGVRAERNDGFAQGVQLSTLPLLGIAVVRGVGDIQVKWRAAYGKGIRAPRTASRETMSGYGRGRDSHGEDAIYRAAIAPESQRGTEAGVDVYVGRAFSLRATRFDQIASGLIQRVIVGIDTTYRGGSSGPRVITYAFQNVGKISNRGWELDGTIGRGPLTMNGSYSLVSSTVRAVDRSYSGDLRSGSRVLEVPANTGSLTAAWTTGSWFGSVTATRASDWINYDRIGLADAVVHDTGPSGAPLGDWLRSYWRHYPGVTRLGAAFSRQLSPSLTAMVTGENLLNEQRGEPDNITVVPGRTLTLGIRTSF